MEVHEHPLIEGTTGVLRSRIDHHDYRGLKRYLDRHNEYSTWEANRFVWLQNAGDDAWSKLNKRQRFKYRHLHRWWLSWFYWAVSLFAMKGFLDGRTGFWLGRLKRQYFQEIRLKIIEAQSQQTEEKRPTAGDRA